MNYKPVFLIKGFLESGKTTLIKETILNGQFHKFGHTLLIVCEEGNNEYDELEFFKYNTDMLIIQDEEELTTEFLETVIEFYNPDRIIFEMNSMWSFSKENLPASYVVKQDITLIDYATFDMYFKNMRQIMANVIKGSEMVIFNNAIDEPKVLANFKRLVLSVDPNVMVIFQNDEGQIDVTLEEELPYDINQDCIKIEDEMYQMFYIDTIQNPNRYIGKKIIMVADILEEEETKRLFVGRNVMNCCADDISFWGHVLQTNPLNLKHEDHGIIEYIIHEGEDGFLNLEAINFTKTKKSKENYV